MLPNASSEHDLRFPGTSFDRGGRIRTADLQSPRLIQPYGGGCPEWAGSGLRAGKLAACCRFRPLFAACRFRAFVPGA
jgi:hypothetical protein